MTDSNSDPIKKPPKFSEQLCYETYKTKTQAWQLVTSVKKESQGLVLALNLPNNEANGIGERIFQELSLSDLQGETGANKFWQYMDRQFQKDDMVQMCETIKAFSVFKRKESQPIKDYINEFESLYMKAKKKGLTDLPPEYLTFLLFENCNLDIKDQRLAMVEVDFTSKEEMFNKSKKNLMKLFGGIKSLTEDTCDSIKMADENSTFYNKNTSFRQNGNFRGGNFRRSPTGRNIPRFSAPQNRISGSASGGGTTPKILAAKLNPSKFGKTMECHQCGARTHLMSACPELNGWTFMNYSQEEAEDMIATIANHHKLDTSNSTNQGEFHEVQSEDDLVDYVGHAAGVLQEEGNVNSSLFNTFHILFSEQKCGSLDVGALKGALNKIVLDTGCVRTVTGKTWMNNLISSMNSESRKLIKINSSSNGFKFGIGETQRSLGQYIVPVKLGKENFMLTTDVIETDIPCLLSKAAMIKSNMIINMANNTINMFGHEIEMVNVPSGHSALVIEPFNLNRAEEFYSFVTMPENTVYNFKKLKHIHEQLGHPSQSTMETMLKNANILNQEIKEIISKLYKSCATCLIHRKAKTRPKVCAPMSQNFNETICMDLKVWPKYGVIILYIIDIFSRFTAAFLVPDKRPESILKPFLDSWILTRFGPPRSILIDNGGEFVNKKMIDLCHNFNIRIFTTAGYSPFQNGICERNHRTVDEIIEKMMTSGKYKTVKEALNPALFAKNIRTSALGFSPFQIVFGSNPRIPGAVENEPPAENGVTITTLVQKRLQSIFDAHKAMAEVENKSRLKAAEKSSHTNKVQFYEIGDEVYYRMGSNTNWSGPGKVIAQDNKLLFIRHGRNLIVASPARVQLVQQHTLPTLQPQEIKLKQSHENEAHSTTVDKEDISDSDEEDNIQNENQIPIGNAHETDEEQPPNTSSPAPEDLEKLQSPKLIPKKKKNKANKKARSYNGSNSRVYPKAGNYVFIKSKDDDSENWTRIKIWQCVTKGTSSPNGPYFNWENSDGTKHGGYLDNYDWHFEGNEFQKGVNTHDDIRSYITYNDEFQNDCQELETDIENTEHSSLITFLPKEEHNTEQAKAAKELELEHFKSYGVYKEVRDTGQPRVSSGWILTRKNINGQEGVKARLVCHGNQQSIWHEETNPKTDSPTVKRKSIKMLITMAAQFGWSVRSQDVTAAFLQAKDLIREVHVQPPKDIQVEGRIWKLIKPMYGLDEASFLWYETLKEFLLQLGCEQLINDPAVFFYRTTQLEGMLTTHVDDLFSAGSKVFEQDIRQPLLQRFKFGSVNETDELKVLGLNILHRNRDIYINQGDYINKKIEYVHIEKKPTDTLATPLIDEDKRLIWQAVGRCRWICDQTRPDICYANLELSIKQRNATHKEVKQVNTMIKRAKENNYSIRYSKIISNIWYLSVFVDASLKGLPEKIESAYGWIILIGGKYQPGSRNTVMPIDWSSGKLNRIVTSTYEAESIALTVATEEAIQLKKEIINLIGCSPDSIQIEVFCDCHDVIASVFSTKDICKSVRVRSDIGRMKQVIEKGEISVLAWIPNEKQLADSLTKASASKIALVSTLAEGQFYH